MKQLALEFIEVSIVVMIVVMIVIMLVVMLVDMLVVMLVAMLVVMIVALIVVMIVVSFCFIRIWLGWHTPPKQRNRRCILCVVCACMWCV